jgi:hypothetical protein
MKIDQNSFEEADIIKANPNCGLSEEALTADEFAAWIEHNRAKWKSRPREAYQVRPCKRVRGFMLHLPVMRWRIWYRTTAAAVSFAKTLVPIYEADCQIYDSSGQLMSN